MKKLPVILTSFGNRKGSSEVRAYLEKRFKAKFPDCEFYWALGSHHFQKLEDPLLPPSPQSILQRLHEEGHKRAVIQSLHIAPAGEYHKLVALSEKAPLQVEISPPLLACEEDCKMASLALSEEMHALSEDTAALLILHGSAHEGGKVFHDMGKIFMKTWGKRAFYGLLEEKNSCPAMVERIRDAGFSKVFFMPFMLASSYHLEKDVLGRKNSWKALFEKHKIRVSIQNGMMGSKAEIADIFLQHLEKTIHARKVI
ncbi:sirohydrochlorin cobaltochelatase [Desulfococcaceae bacterium OttesenSCG-928-F15]|nr:sirohydrochlorin cobaltochelatase [Desulfococcaceae bacterium OttesenSCG-928-F15]